MELPNLLAKIKTSPESAQQFVAIEIAANSIKTAIWQVKDQQTQLVALGSIQDWESDEDTDLLLAIDTSLSEAYAGLDEEPNEVIFGLPETWVGEEAIAEGKKPVLKMICQKLGLKPVGFVVTTEAVVHYLQDTEGGPPSAILIHITREQVIVSLVNLGKLEGVQVVGRSGEISADVAEGLARFSSEENFPNRMVLYDSKEDLEAIKQELIAYDWQKQLAFLHFPQIELLPKESTIQAVALSGGAEVAKSMGLTLVAGARVGAEDEKEEKEAEDVGETAEEEPAEVDDFGFEEVVIDMSDSPETDTEEEKEVAEEAVSEEPETEEKQEVAEEKKEPVVKKAAAPEPELVPVEAEEVFATVDEDELELEDVVEQPVEKKKRRLPKLGLSLGFLKRRKTANKSGSWAKKPRFGRLRAPSMLVMGLVIMVVIVVAGGIYYWQVPEADVTIFLRPESLDRDITFTLDPEASEVDLEARVIPVALATEEASGSTQTPTTGTQTIGERATGQVEIFNRTLNQQTLAAGTAIKNGSLAFTLNDEVTIASASSQENDDFTITLRPTSAQAAVTAADIGTQYNLGDGTQFAVGDFASEDFVARALGAMSGGTSQQIQAVSEEDVARVDDELLTELNQQIEQKVSEQSAGQKGVIPAAEPEIQSQEYSAEIGDEASSLSLSASSTQDIYTYETKDISLLGQQQILSEIPDGFEMMAAATQISVQESEINEDGTVSITARVSIKLIPTIDTRQVVENIQGKYPPDTQEYLRTLPNYESADVTIRPSLPARLNTFPRKAENIHVSVEGNQ